MTTIQTILARDIDTENIDIRYDRSVKRVLANTPLLAPITKYTVRELKNYSIPMIEKCIDADSIQVSQVFVEPGLTNRKILNDELESKIPSEGRAIFDIRFTITLPDGSRTKIIINIEAQQKSNPGYSLLNRGIFYASRLISAQLSVEFTNDGSDKKQYDNMKKVYSIWICMDCPENKKDSIINYSFEPHIIYQGNDKLKVYENCDLMNITFIHLSGKPDQSHHRLISMLDTLLAKMDAETKKKKLQEEHNLPMTIKLEKEMNDMCNLSAGIREEGIRDGILIGEINTLRDMLKAGLTTIEKLRESGLYSPDVLAALSN
ncbi:PD-(D/E)XK nuclease family transposase [Anaerovibrio slackiae]|uniref:PD-(D/E)XK nuclease family transposase n=1 Tax=Anaerovibrio slackiae TaxID=2652309 RepID=UPI0038654FB3